MNSKGWKRLAIVLFLVWTAVISIYIWSQVISDARRGAQYALSSCISSRSVAVTDPNNINIRMQDGTVIQGVPKDLSHEKLLEDYNKYLSKNKIFTNIKKEIIYKGDVINCSDEYSRSYQESRNNFLEEWWVVPLLILVPPILILLTWVMSYGIIKVYYWIMKGFRTLDKPTKMAKKSWIMTGVFILTFILSISLLTFKNSINRKAIETAIAECELDQIKSRVDDIKKENFIRTCMQTRQYKFKYLESFCSTYSATYFNCYE